MDERDHLELFIKGAIIGHLVGDALGHPYKGILSGKMPPLHFIRMRKQSGSVVPSGTYSNYGSTMLCVMASLVEADGLDSDDLFSKWRDWYVGGYMTPDDDSNVGGDVATSSSLKMFVDGTPSDLCSVQDDEAKNVGALARTLPIGLFFCSGPLDPLIESAHSAAKLTHNNLHSEVVCALYSLIVRNFLTDDPVKVFDQLEDYYKVKKLTSYSKQLSEIKELKSETEGDLAGHIFWRAWDDFCNNNESTENCVIRSVSRGDDTSATACLSGGLTGLTLGLNDIPQRWLNELRLTSEVMQKITEFVDAVLDRMLEG